MAPRSLMFILLLSLPTPFLLLPYASASNPAPDVVDLDYLMMNTGARGDAPADPAYNPYGQALFSDDSPQNPEPFNESHVVVLTAANFSSFLAVRRHVVVDFYAPLCSWSRKLAPEYAAAASHLVLVDKEIDVALAKTEDNGLAYAHGIRGYPTVLFFIDGVSLSRYTYYGERTK